MAGNTFNLDMQKPSFALDFLRNIAVSTITYFQR